MSECDKGTCFANAMVDVSQAKEDLWNRLVDLKKQGCLPDLQKKMKYKVYSFRGSECGAQMSIVLSADNENFVTVELIVDTVDGKKYTILLTRPLAKSLVRKMSILGKFKIQHII